MLQVSGEDFAFDETLILLLRQATSSSLIWALITTPSTTRRFVSVKRRGRRDGFQRYQ